MDKHIPYTDSYFIRTRKIIQEKIVAVEIISNRAQDLVANFHQLLYKDR